MGIAVTEARPLRLHNDVRKLRMARGWTLDEAAVRCGVARRAIQNIEGDEGHVPSGSTMLRIAAAFGLSMGEVFWSVDAEAAA